MQPYSIKITCEFSLSQLQKGVYIVVTEARKIPPHIGMMVNGNFSSLTVKGNEIDVPAGVLLKNIQLRKIPSLFIKIADHPVFSAAFLNELFASCVAENKRVEAGGPTCLSPVKTFFREAFHLKTGNVEFLFDLLPLLEKNELIAGSAMFFPGEELHENSYELPLYTKKEIDSQIEKVRLEYR